jgi:hypothetical protein
MVNGGDVEEVGYNGASIVPTLDSIQEFRLLTNSFDAEFGHFSGAVVNVITKSRTNAIHGTVFEFLRNDKLDAQNFFDRNLTDPKTGAEIPNSARGVFQRNQYGLAFGGPIMKNRHFSSATIRALARREATRPVMFWSHRFRNAAAIFRTLASQDTNRLPASFAATTIRRTGLWPPC